MILSVSSANATQNNKNMTNIDIIDTIDNIESINNLEPIDRINAIDNMNDVDSKNDVDTIDNKKSDILNIEKANEKTLKEHSLSEDDLTIYVSSNGTVDGDGSLENPYPSLENAINNAKDKSLIILLNGSYANNGSYKNTGFIIDKEITIASIQNANAIINGQNNDFLFRITETGKLNLKSLTLENGMGDTSSESPILNYGTLNIESSTLRNNTGFVGGIVNYGKISISNSNISSNRGTNLGDIVNYDDLRINNSILYKNTLFNYGNIIFNNSYTDYGLISENILNKSVKANINNSTLKKDIYAYLDINQTEINITDSNFDCDSEFFTIDFRNSNVTVRSSIFNSPISLRGNNSIDIKYSSLYWVLGSTNRYENQVNLSQNWWKSNKGPKISYLDNFYPESWIIANYSSASPLKVNQDSNVSIILRFANENESWEIGENIKICPLSVRFESENGEFTKKSGIIRDNKFDTFYYNNSENTLIYSIIDKERLKLLVGCGYTNYSIYISPNGNDSFGNGSIDNPYQSLKKALSKALNGNTIYLYPGVYKGVDNCKLTINKKINIKSLDNIPNEYTKFKDGEDVIISTYLNSHIFYVLEWGELSFNHIIFNQEHSSDYNNLIISSGGIININNSLFDSIASTGLISTTEGYYSYGNTNIENTNFINIQGVSIYGTTAVNLSNCNFTKGSIVSPQYEYKSVIANCNDIVIKDCNFIDNNLSAIYSGYVSAGGSGLIINKIEISQSKFIRNLGNIYGEAFTSISVVRLRGEYKNPTVVKDCYFGENKGYTLLGANRIINSTFISNTENLVIANGDSYYGDDVRIYNSTFINNTNNKTTTDDYYNNGIIYNGGNLTVEGSTFINNTAAYGGAIYNHNTANIKNSIFINNTAKYLGNDIFNRLGTMNASSNWWGSNEGPTKEKAYRFLGDLILDNWVIMTLSVENNTNITKGNSFNGNNSGNNSNYNTSNKNSFIVKVALDKVTDNDKNIYSLEGTLPNNRIAYINCSYGTINESSLEIINGSNFFIVYSNLTNNDALVTARIDNQVLNLTISNRNTEILMDNYVLYGEKQVINLTLINVNGYRISNQTVDISIINSSGELIGIYEALSDDEGFIKLELNLIPDLYRIESHYKGNGYFEPNYSNSTLNVLVAQTNIISYNETYYGKNNNFYTILKDSFNNVLVNKTICYNITNGENYFLYYSNTNGNGRSDIYLSIDPGNYTIKSYFVGDSWYESSSSIAKIRINPRKSQIVINDRTLNGFGEIFSFKLLDDEGNYIVNENVVLIISQYNISQNFNLTTDDNALASISINLLPGQYNLTAIYSGNKNYGPSNGTAILTVERVISRIVCDLNTNLTSTGNILKIKLIDLYGKEIINQTVNLIIYQGETEYSNETMTDLEGMGYFYLDLNPGNYIGTLSYDGNDWYGSSNTGISLTVDSNSEKVNNITLIGNDLIQYYGEDNYFNITFNDPNAKTLLNKEITVSIESENSYANYNLTTDIEGVCRLKIDFAPGNYTVNYKYDNIYYGIHVYNSSKITVLKTPTQLNAPNLVVKYGDWKFYEVNLKDIKGNNIKSKVILLKLSSSSGLKEYNITTDDYGIARLKVDFNPGTYDVELEYAGDGNYYSCQNTSKIVISTENKTNTILSGEDIETLSKRNQYYEVKLTDFIEGPIKGANLEMEIINLQTNESRYYNLTTDNEGKIRFDLNLLDDGEYLSFVSFRGNDEYLESHTNNLIKIKFNENETRIVSNDIEKYYKNDTQLEGDLIDNLNRTLSNKEISLIIDKVEFKATTDEKGHFKINIDLDVGKHEGIIIFKGDETYSSSMSKVNITIIKADLVCKETIIKKGDKLIIKFTDNNNKKITGEKIDLKILGKTYTKTTNENGEVSLKINLKANNYKLEAVMVNQSKFANLSKKFNIKVVTKFKTSLIGNNLVKYYKNSSQMIIKLIDERNYTIANKTIKMTIKNSKSTYKFQGKTGSNGKIQFNINIPKGTYTATLSFNEDANFTKSTKKLSVKVLSPKITAVSKKIKKGKYFQVIFKDSNGKVIKNQRVVFKVGKKTYEKTTNSKGIAKLKINLKIGTYSIKNYFKSRSLYGGTSITTKIKVVK